MEVKTARVFLGWRASGKGGVGVSPTHPFFGSLSPFLLSLGWWGFQTSSTDENSRGFRGGQTPLTPLASLGKIEGEYAVREPWNWVRPEIGSEIRKNPPTSWGVQSGFFHSGIFPNDP